MIPKIFLFQEYLLNHLTNQDYKIKFQGKITLLLQI